MFFFFTEELVPIGPLYHIFICMTLLAGGWGAWALGKPCSSGPQKHSLLAPSPVCLPYPIFQTSCPLLSLPPADV